MDYKVISSRMDKKLYEELKFFSIDHDLHFREVLEKSVIIGFPLLVEEYKKEEQKD